MDLADPFVNIGNTAALYSQVAGVLAGFAFTGLLLYLNRTPDQPGAQDGSGTAPATETAEQRHASNSANPDQSQDARRDVAVVLFNTLGALIICAILYGQLAGGAPASESSFSGVLLDGPAFSLAILGMFYATALAATPFPHLTAMVGTARLVVGVVGPAICMILIAGAAHDIGSAACATNTAPSSRAPACQANDQLAFDRPYGLGLLLTGLLFVTSLGLLAAFRKPDPRPRSWIPPAMAAVILGAAVVTVGGNVYLTTRPADYLLPDASLRAVLLVTFAVLTGFSAMTIRSCHHTPHPAAERSTASQVPPQKEAPSEPGSPVAIATDPPTLHQTPG